MAVSKTFGEATKAIVNVLAPALGASCDLLDELTWLKGGQEEHRFKVVQMFHGIAKIHLGDLLQLRRLLVLSGPCSDSRNSMRSCTGSRSNSLSIACFDGGSSPVADNPVSRERPLEDFTVPSFRSVCFASSK